MARPSARQVAQEVADTARELRKEGLLDEWGEAFGLHMAQNILDRDKVKKNIAKAMLRQNDARKVEAAE